MIARFKVSSATRIRPFVDVFSPTLCWSTDDDEVVDSAVVPIKARLKVLRRARSADAGTRGAPPCRAGRARSRLYRVWDAFDGERLAELRASSTSPCSRRWSCGWFQRRPGAAARPHSEVDYAKRPVLAPLTCRTMPYFRWSGSAGAASRGPHPSRSITTSTTRRGTRSRSPETPGLTCSIAHRRSPSDLLPVLVDGSPAGRDRGDGCDPRARDRRLSLFVARDVIGRLRGVGLASLTRSSSCRPRCTPRRRTARRPAGTWHSALARRRLPAGRVD